MECEFAAHKKDDGTIQTIEQHCIGVAELAAEYAAKPFKTAARYLGLNHDIGKYRKGFQSRINGKSTLPCEHACVGAQEIERQTKTAEKYFRCLSPMFEYCVAGHHTGLQNGTATSKNAQGTLKDALGRDVSDIEDRRSLFEENAKPPDDSTLSDFVSLMMGVPNQEATERYAFFTRYLFSCLTDADFIDTERFCDDEAVRGMTGNFKAALERVNSCLDNMTSESEVCQARKSLQKQAFDNSRGAKISILDMPTGSGKTLCSIKLALERAVESGKKRIIYVIPFTSIIEQTAKRFEELFGDVLPVLQHHHNFSFDNTEQPPELLRKTTENWDAPLIVTTNVQFFESLYHNKSSRLRKLHNMADSVIIFDEVHMMPVEYLQPCMRGVGYLTEFLDSEAIFMSATMPDFSRLLGQFTPVKDMAELITDKSMFPAFSNCEYIRLGGISDEQLLNRADKFSSSLVIVNSRRKARQLYKSCTCHRKFCLSTYMTPEHRSRVISEIREAIGREKIAVFSTSLIEAGVDLDFEAVFRELSGLDSVIQSAGRCNREGMRPKGYMHIFELEGSTIPQSLKLKANICRSMLDEYPDISSQECAAEYYRRLYCMNDSVINSGSIYQDNMTPKSIPFADYAEQFSLIDSDSVNVVIPCAEIAADIAALEYGGRNLYRKLALYSASVQYYEFKDLWERGVISQKGGAYVLEMPCYYDEDTGLDPEYTFDGIVDLK